MKNANGKMLAIFSVLVAFAALMSFGSYVGFANTDNVTINVTVQALTEITVTPYNITWQSILPGTVGGERNVTVQNTGSVNATNLYAFMTTLENETIRPYSADEASAYSAGGVVVFRNSSTRSNMSWAGRIEWNWTTKIANVDWSGINSATNGVKAEGFIRNTTVQFYWAAANGTVDSGNPTQAYCNNSEALLAISDSEDNGTSITRRPTTTGITNNGGDENWSYFSVTRPTSFLAGSCIALDVNCTKIYITKYDKRTSGPWAGGTTCANANFITAGPITPSQFETVTANVWMPKGVPAGFMKIATWTFVVT